MRGRKPALKIVEGAAPTGKVPSPPSALDAHGKAEWKRVAPILHSRGQLDEGVISTLEAYCRAVALSRTYAAILKEEGHTVQTEKGVVSHPIFKQLMAVTREHRLFAAELSLTPQRKKAGTPEGDTGDGWDPALLA